ncbi:MAG: BadF/BadG/BcrA/BcrD ATPase family protein, partial [Candidatus Kryptoniota bacterium]
SAVYQNNFDVASAAPIVIEAAEKGDEVALEIVMVNTDELMLHISAMLKKLKKPLPLVLVGSILSSDNIFSRVFRKKIENSFPELKIQDPEFPPAVGAALLAFKMGEM